MRLKFEINNSENYEYLIHGQDLQIKFQIPYCLFTIVRYKQLHTRIWFHKSFSSIYYLAPFFRFHNFLVGHKFPGFKNRKLISTNFDYPGSSYNFKPNFIPKCILDNKFKIMPNEGAINTIANIHYPTIVFVGIGFGLRIFRKKLNVKIIDLKEEVITIKNNIQYPIINNDLTNINTETKRININQNSISFNKSIIELKTLQPKITINKSLTNINHFIEN